jgi:DNA-binding transcriptional MocR family regulator
MKHGQKQEKRKADRHIRLYHWLMRSPAWKSLSGQSRALYAELAKYYNGRNNGKIGYSIRQAAEDLQVAEGTASRHLRILTERGFIEPMKKGAFSLKERHATEWRMTEFICDVTGQPPTKDFMRWQPDQNLEHDVEKRHQQCQKSTPAQCQKSTPENETPPPTVSIVDTADATLGVNNRHTHTS